MPDPCGKPAVAVVTGAATGIGRSIAERLARDGATVALLDLEDCGETQARIERSGGRVGSFRCDLRQPESVAEAARAVGRDVGATTILVNSAGVYPNAPFSQVDLAAWRDVLAVNLDGPFLTCKAFVPAMEAAGVGRIVNISATAVAGNSPGFVAYIASKMGLIGLTRSLASDVGGAGITVNSVAPGLTRTDRTSEMWKGTPLFERVAEMQAIERTAVPADLAGAVSFLASEEASFITGQTLAVDGGAVRF
jgi:NAD(P)-dependent dehydrogenase (short-subunit alcohol dehydrogenase family)